MKRAMGLLLMAATLLTTGCAASVGYRGYYSPYYGGYRYDRDGYRHDWDRHDGRDRYHDRDDYRHY
jgi:hypothetical protein